MRPTSKDKINRVRVDSNDSNGDEKPPANGTGTDSGTLEQEVLLSRFARSQSSLSGSRKRLLAKILDESNETYFLSSRDMGKRYGVNSATVIRTIQALGYEKFADFSHDLQEHFVTKITPYTAMKAAEQTALTIEDRIRQSIEKDIENLTDLRRDIEPERLVEFAGRINISQRIVIVGIDFAASLANALAYGLVRLGFDADAPIGSSGVIQNRLKIMTPKDLLIAISFGRGLRETIDAVRTARRRNIPSFGITNGDQTPIAKYCDSYLIASIARTSFIDSYAAPVAAINALLVACAHSQSARSLEHLRQFEEEYAASHRWYSEDAASI